MNTITTQTTKSFNLKSLALWALQLAGAGMFLMAASGKLTGNPQMVGLFEAIGIGQWFRIFTGSLEVVGAILLLIPGLQAFGAALLIPTMIGAIATHLFIVGGNPAIPAALLVAMVIVAWGRRQQILKRIVK